MGGTVLRLLRSAPADPDARLIDAAIGGDPSARALLVSRLMPVIRARIARSMARLGVRRLDAADCDDLAQEVWLVLMKDGAHQLAAYRSERGASLETYVAMIAQREVYNRLSRQLRLKRGSRYEVSSPALAEASRDPAQDPEAHVVSKDMAVQLEEHLMTTLPKKAQLIFRYTFTDGLDADEIASILGVTRQVIYNWQHKIRTAAEEFLQAHHAPG